MGGINTNMASEFWFFSQLHRLGYEAYITLGNTKAVDLLVVLNDANRTKLTFDVKGKESFRAGGYNYLPPPPYRPNHFFAFVGLEIKRHGKRVSFSQDVPHCFIMEANALPSIAGPWGSSGGFGFSPWLLPYLKSAGATRCPKNGLVGFQAKFCPSGINFATYQQSILTLDDFESRYHKDK